MFTDRRVRIPCPGCASRLHYFIALPNSQGPSLSIRSPVFLEMLRMMSCFPICSPLYRLPKDPNFLFGDWTIKIHALSRFHSCTALFYTKCLLSIIFYLVDGCVKFGDPSGIPVTLRRSVPVQSMAFLCVKS